MCSDRYVGTDASSGAARNFESYEKRSKLETPVNQKRSRLLTSGRRREGDLGNSRFPGSVRTYACVSSWRACAAPIAASATQVPTRALPPAKEPEFPLALHTSVPALRRYGCGEIRISLVAAFARRVTFVAPPCVRGSWEPICTPCFPFDGGVEKHRVG